MRLLTLLLLTITAGRMLAVDADAMFKATDQMMTMEFGKAYTTPVLDQVTPAKAEVTGSYVAAKPGNEMIDMLLPLILHADQGVTMEGEKAEGVTWALSGNKILITAGEDPMCLLIHTGGTWALYTMDVAGGVVPLKKQLVK